MPKEDYISVRQLLAEVNTLDVENFVVRVEREGKDLILSPEALSALMKVDTNGRLHGMADTSGRITEASAATISANVGAARGNILRTPFGHTAAGNALDGSATYPWSPIPSVVGAGTVITADAAGNIGAAADIIAAGTLKLDAYMICQVNTTGSYTTKWCEAASTAPAVAVPDYNTAGHIAYMVAGYPYILRIMNTTAATTLGYNTGVNGNWPNNAVMYITGWTREVA